MSDTVPPPPSVVVAARARGSLEPAQDADVLVNVSVGPAGEPIALWCAPEDLPALTAMGVLPEPRSPRPVTARVTIHRAGVTEVRHIDGLELAHPTVQPLPDGVVIVVGARSEWHGAVPDRNAVRYDGDGRAISEHALGDGIQHVLATPSGALWVGYDDEGVFGTYGWGDPGPAPIGAPGLLRFTAGLDIDWAHPDDAPLGPIDDCYALNVDGETAWACYYCGTDEDFPLVRIERGVLTGWHNRVATGATALAVDGSAVALYGGYDASHDRLVLAEIRDEELAVIGQYRLVLPDGSVPPPAYGYPARGGIRVVGRGAQLHIFHGPRWYTLHPAELPRASSHRGTD